MLRRTATRTLVLVAAVTGALFAGSAPAASAAEPRFDVDDFDFSSWDATYQVGLDEDGRARMHVEETRVAEFPDFDQNRGIVAGFPLTYEGARLDTEIISVRDGNGEDVPYETEDDDDMLYVLTGDDDYVHGSTTYVIEYEMRDVILAAEGTEVDEFYWNLLPLDSTQDIGAFHAEIVFDDDLASHLTGNSSCYKGEFGSDEPCGLRTSGDNIFIVDSYDIPAGSGITVAIAFDAGTVTQPSARIPNAATDVLPYVLGGGAVLVSIGGWFAAHAMIRSCRRGTGIIVAQYDVPESMSPLLAHAIIPGAKNPLTAEIVHLAVGGSLRIEKIPDETAKKTSRPRLRRLRDGAQNPLDTKALKSLFGDAEVGQVVTMPKNNQKFASRMQALLKAGPAAAAKRGLTTKAVSPVARGFQIVALALFAVMVILMFWGLFTGRASADAIFFAVIVCGIFLLFSTAATFYKYTVLTKEGALQLEYLEGVREFIRVAEADRLRMLQSYTGADRRSDGSVDVIHVYEKLLPYAILFGQERRWGEVLEYAYGQAQQSASWSDGSSIPIGTQIALLSSSTRTSSTYSSPTSGSSSSFGGSSGGGFSGGGGGGGFSGGR